MAPSTLTDLAAEQQVSLPDSLRAAVGPQAALRLPADERGWFRFQRMYDAARAVVRSESSMRRIVREAAEADAAEGSRRLELQVDPTSYAPYVGGITPALEIVLDEARSASADTGVEVAIIVATSRTRHPLDARTLARLAARHASDGPGGVIGVGLSNDERRGDTSEFAGAFQIAARAGLSLVPHGGELLGPDHVREVVAHLHPDRLGHGVRAAEDPELLDRLVADGIAPAVCPASTASLVVYAAPAVVPSAHCAAAGAQIALGADAPLLFGSRLLAQYEAARSVHGFSAAQLAGLARSSITASRASQSTTRSEERRVGKECRAPSPRAY